MSRLKKTFIFLGGIFFLVFVTLCALYTIMWFLLAGEIQKQIDFYWAQIQQNPAIETTIAKPVVSGFPLPPEVHISGDILLKPDVLVRIKDAYFYGFPLSGLTVYFEATNGIEITHPEADKAISVDFAAANVTLPEHPPMTDRYTDIKAWQLLDDPVLINGIHIISGAVKINASGFLKLDDQLQPALQLQSRIYGIDQFFTQLENDGLVRQKDLKAAQTFLNMISQIDPESGLRYFDTSFLIRQRSIFIGPMRVWEHEKIIWPESPQDPTDLSRRALRPE